MVQSIVTGDASLPMLVAIKWDIGYIHLMNMLP